ncbi:protein phosphatase 1, regulatory subunit 17-like [Sardina pilchardus]|uniref:protein phosphatase 1, regulatory subunit 17-like n=1 Tax=Sardina pilchardus TaxID=27697 RepID=UPI002E13B432
MSTGCVRSPPETAEHRLQGQEAHYGLCEPQETLRMERQKERGSGELHADDQHDDQEHKKPRRKDTPVLNTHPLIPGVRQMKGEARLIHLEDEEKDVKN